MSMNPCIVLPLTHPSSTHHEPVPLTYILHSNDFVKIYVKSRTKVQFSAAVLAVSMKPCIVIVLQILLKHAPSWGYDSVIRRMKSLVCVVIDSVCVFSIFALELEDKQGRERWKGRSWSYYTSYAFRQL